MFPASHTGPGPTSGCVSGGGGLRVYLPGLCDCPRRIPGRTQDPALPQPRSPCPRGCSLSHEQDGQATGRVCQAASKAGLLQELGPGSFLCGGRWGSGSELLSLAPAQLPTHTHTHTSRVRSSHCDEPQKVPSASSFLIDSFAEASHSGSLEAAWLPGPVRLA